MVKIAIIGSRNLERKDVSPFLHFLIKLKEDKLVKDLSVISGGARGVDTYVEDYCDINKIPIKIIRPINPANKMDYLFRNIEIITEADQIVAIYDGKSKGTKFVIDYAKARNKIITIIDKMGTA